MACACNKRRQPTGYGTVTPRPADRQPEPAPEPVQITLRLPNGEEHIYNSKLEAHAARLRMGGEFV